MLGIVEKLTQQLPLLGRHLDKASRSTMRYSGAVSADDLKRKYAMTLRKQAPDKQWRRPEAALPGAAVSRGARAYGVYVSPLRYRTVADVRRMRF